MNGTFRIRRFAVGRLLQCPAWGPVERRGESIFRVSLGLRRAQRWVPRGVAAAGALLLSLGCSPSGPTFHAERTPETLRAWGLFQEVEGSLVAHPEVLPYELNTPLFSDYARKYRTVWIEGDQPATLGREGVVEFPVGTVLSKTFYYPRAGADGVGVLATRSADDQLPEGGIGLAEHRLVETRLLVRREAGWVSLPYVWNEAQTDARLQIAGAAQQLELLPPNSEGSGPAAVDPDDRRAQETTSASERFHYIVPDANQCAGCHVTHHSDKLLRPIGPRIRHLNRPVTVRGERVDQLTLWSDLGLLDLGTTVPAEAARNVLSSDPGKASIDERARSYLDINCGHCHNPFGPADTSGLFLDKGSNDPRRLGVCKPPIAAGRGSGGRLVSIEPGQPDESIMPFRMRSTDPGIAMPELGRSTVDWEGVELIREWIASLEGECSPALLVSGP